MLSHWRCMHAADEQARGGGGGRPARLASSSSLKPLPRKSNVSYKPTMHQGNPKHAHFFTTSAALLVWPGMG